ncbi:SpaA isopeptide-forming pilin-related protein [Enterococcus sp. DIV0756]|uniref:SpaA isopeptide-forming pilin-related protein n=1 Tax=Enterococcus sp. DIV0756 TaxID=2774636 RepID=UPI003F299D5B
MRKVSCLTSVALTIGLLLSLIPFNAGSRAENLTNQSGVLVTNATILDVNGVDNTSEHLVREQEPVTIEIDWQMSNTTLIEEGASFQLNLPKELTYANQNGQLSDGMGSFQVSEGMVHFTFARNYQMEVDERLPDYSSVKHYQGSLSLEAEVPKTDSSEISLDFGNQVVRQLVVESESKEAKDEAPIGERNSEEAPLSDGRSLNDLGIWVMRSWQVLDGNDKEFTEENPPTRNDNITINFNWKLENEVEILDKDFYTFQLEDYFAVHKSVRDEPLENENGPSLGTFDLTTDGLLTIKFNENVEKYSNRQGTIHISTQLDVDEQETEIITEKEIDDEGNATEETRIPILKAAIQKNGSITEGKEIVWEVIINDDWRELSNVKVTDFVGANHEYRSYACQIQEEKDGEWKNAPSGFCFRNYDEKNDQHVFNFSGLEREGKKLTHPVKFIIRTQITNAESETVSYSNSAAIEGSNFRVHRVDASVDLVNIKNYKFLYDSDFDKGILNWRIKATVKNDNGIIVDQMCQDENYPRGALHYLDEDSLKISDAKGEPLNNDDWDFVQDKKITHDGKIVRFGIQFKKKGVYYLDYTTKAFTIPLPVNQKIINKLWIEDEFYDGSSGITDDDLLGVIKTHDDAKVDYTKREIPWTTTINVNKILMKNAEITDLYGTVDGGSKTAHCLVEDSLKIYPYDDEGNVDETKPLKNGTDYELKFMEENTDYKAGFVIKLKGETYGSTNETLELRYNTRFFMEDQNNTGANPTKKSNYFRNSARVKYWNEQEEICYDSDEDEMWINNNFSQNGWKYGTFVVEGAQYKGQTSPFEKETPNKDTVYWSVPLNIWQTGMKRGTVINETLTGDQSNPEVKIYKIKNIINVDGGNKLGDLGDELKVDTDYRIGKNTDDPSKFDIELLKDIDEMFAVFIKVDAGDETHKYQNRAFIDLGDDAVDVDLSASVDKSSAFNWINKTGEQVKEGQNFELEAKYTIVLNRDGRTVKDTVVTDTVVSNQQTFQRENEDQPKVKAWTSYNNQGTYVKDKPIDLTGEKSKITNDIAGGTQTMTLSLGTIKSPILIEYYTDISPAIPNDTSITNSAQLKGKEQEISTSKKNIIVKNTRGSGTSTGVDGSLRILKKDESDELIKDGAAIFDLFTVDNTTKEKTPYYTGIQVQGDKILQIGNDVQTPPLDKIGNLRYGTYAIKETKAPDGYDLDDTLREFTIDENTSDHEYVYEHINKKTKPFELSILKQNEDGDQGLEGGEFSLYESAPEKPLATAKTEDNGIGKFVDSQEAPYVLQLGKTYKVKETKAPEGFVKLKGEFTVSISSKGDVTVKYDGDDLKDADVIVKKSTDDKNSQIQFTARNNPRTPLPKTGGAGGALLVTLGLVGLIVGLWYHFPLKKKEGLS